MRKEPERCVVCDQRRVYHVNSEGLCMKCLRAFDKYIALYDEGRTYEWAAARARWYAQREVLSLKRIIRRIRNLAVNVKTTDPAFKVFLDHVQQIAEEEKGRKR